MKLYLVSGAHHEVPNTQLSAHLTPASADVEALRLVNMIRDDAPRDGLDSDEGTPSLAALPAGADWREGLRKAQRCIISFNKKLELDDVAMRMLDDDDLVRNSRANVEIVELDVQGLPDPAAVVADLIEAGEAADRLLRQPGHRPTFAVNSYAAAAKLRDAIQMVRLAAIWQSQAQPFTLSGMTTAEIVTAITGGAMMFESPPCQLSATPRPRRDHLPGDLLGDRVIAGQRPGETAMEAEDRRAREIMTPPGTKLDEGDA